jgi:hypothetical protein
LKKQRPFAALAKSFSLSPRERAGVRGKKSCEFAGVHKLRCSLYDKQFFLERGPSRN